ncbi:hypothetical protein E2562_033092 [Oryza meyeriana var. granulata]|uniref:Uncharacterized protein n=1 Tax=Oryza meyeriana var. granulata TaxID=110450 RepID=A0A6G1DRC8_9ORYZ|nr:hypothetical protein E2562_033092 [Oryza meyeriana var. granulata]
MIWRREGRRYARAPTPAVSRSQAPAKVGVEERATAIGLEELVAAVEDAAMDPECRSHQPPVIGTPDQAASVLGDVK